MDETLNQAAVVPLSVGVVLLLAAGIIAALRLTQGMTAAQTVRFTAAMAVSAALRILPALAATIAGSFAFLVSLSLGLLVTLLILHGILPAVPQRSEANDFAGVELLMYLVMLAPILCCGSMIVGFAVGACVASRLRRRSYTAISAQ